MKGLTLVLTHDDIAATLAPLYAQYNRDSRDDYETRRDYPETLYNAEKRIDANVCTARMRDYGNRIRGVERMLAAKCGVEFSHNDRFYPCHEFEKVYISVEGIAYTVFNAETDSK